VVYSVVSALKQILVTAAVVTLLVAAGCGAMNPEPGEASYHLFVDPVEDVPEGREAISVDNKTLQTVTVLAEQMESPPSSDARKVDISKREYENAKSTVVELPPSVLSKDGTELYVRADGAVYRVDFQRLIPA
jgi:hypothetical protein